MLPDFADSVITFVSVAYDLLLTCWCSRSEIRL